MNAQAEAASLLREFQIWQFRKALTDEQRVATILKSWGIQVGRA
jgi:hypothetical protein